jgi:hypothetical protein
VSLQVVNMSAAATKASADAALRADVKQQIESLNDLHRRIAAACWSKCIPGARSNDGEMSIGEMTCIDRCVNKYVETLSKVRHEVETIRGNVPVDYP